MTEIASRANEIVEENHQTKEELMNQINSYEGLFEDRQGLEVAYRRMHEINHLIKDIEKFWDSQYNMNLKKVICTLPDEIHQGIAHAHI